MTIFLHNQGSAVLNLTKLLADIDIKISILKYGKYIDIFCWKKMQIAFA